MRSPMPALLGDDAMTDVVDIFDEFKQEFRRAGFADPRPFLAMASADDRRALSALIDAYLEAAPPASVGDAAYADSVARRLVDALDQVAADSAGLWPRVLPLLRKRTQLRRKDVVARLTSELGLEGGEDLVKTAFHDMESGRLDSEDVQLPVLEALGRMLGESAETLHTLGRRLGPPHQQLVRPEAFARAGNAIFNAVAVSGDDGPPVEDPRRQQLERRVNALFRGGGAREA
jgi:hypothetical protein